MKWLHDLEQAFRMLGLAMCFVGITAGGLGLGVDIARAILGGLRFGP